MTQFWQRFDGCSVAFLSSTEGRMVLHDEFFQLMCVILNFHFHRLQCIHFSGRLVHFQPIYLLDGFPHAAIRIVLRSLNEVHFRLQHTLEHLISARLVLKHAQDLQTLRVQLDLHLSEALGLLQIMQLGQPIRERGRNQRQELLLARCNFHNRGEPFEQLHTNFRTHAHIFEMPKVPARVLRLRCIQQIGCIGQLHETWWFRARSVGHQPYEAHESLGTIHHFSRL
mmetsp:Transcript_28830/g.48411  ORF Transcript_28830/g.48411 Transcript_28830/m.48411 type:complete len:226 (-) Transcript_28830:171-848(-)